MTFRNFSNAIFGYNKKQELLSRERYLQTRKIVWAALRPYAKDIQETDIMEFEWEVRALELQREKDAQEALQGLEETKKFWERIDKKRAEKKTDT